MKKVMLALMLFMVTACTRIPAGYVGIVIDQFGTQKGVQDIPLRTGMVWYTPWAEDVYTFPTFYETRVWSEEKSEHSRGGENMVMQSVEGAVIRFDVTLTGAFVADSVPRVFVDFRKAPNEIVNTNFRSIIMEEFSNRANRMQVTEIFGSGRKALQDSARIAVTERLSRHGFKIQQLAVIGDLRVDPEVQKSINAVLTQRQKSIEAETKVATARAEADQLIESARGDSAASVIRATGQAEANRKLSASINGGLVAWETAKRWDGVLPQVTGGSIPMVDLRKPDQQ